MHKCTKCGTEFNGNFCPECGEKFAEEKICPKCGATLPKSAKYCNECGYSFENPESAPLTEKPERTAKPFTAGTKKLYNAVSVLPAALFALFSVLLFLFFLAPAAAMPGTEFLGEKIPSTSYGNIYEFSYYDGSSLTGSMIALIVLAAFALGVAIFAAATNLFSKLRYRRFTVAGKKIFLCDALTCFGYVLFFVLFLVSCILLGQIASEDGGLGMMKAGAAPVLVLVFTLLGCLAFTGCVVAEIFLRRNYPELAALQEENIAEAKPTAAETWIKKHKAWAIGISAVLVVAMIICVAVPIGLANRHNGTYYAYNGETEEYDMTRYYTLSGGSWEDENGTKGKIKFNGGKVTLAPDSSDGFGFGPSELTTEGTISGDVLKIGEVVYAKKGHKHTTNNWKTVVEPTCTTAGMRSQTCACGRGRQEELPALGHSFTNHICNRCGQNSSITLEYTLNEEQTEYSVTGIGSCNDPELIIPASYENKPVTSIGERAFANCAFLISITFPNSVTEIGVEAFYGCDGLTDIAIPDSVTTIDDHAFYRCTNLNHITIPDSVTAIGAYAFSDTAYSDNASNWENDVLYIGHHLVNAKESISGSCTIRAGTKTIAQYAFAYCNNLTSVVIADSVASLAICTFYNDENLTSVTIGSGVKSIAIDSLACPALTDIRYNGSIAAWKDIKKDPLWALQIWKTLGTIITCTDGTIAMDGTETYFNT